MSEMRDIRLTDKGRRVMGYQRDPVMKQAFDDGKTLGHAIATRWMRDQLLRVHTDHEGAMEDCLPCRSALAILIKAG